ncbi:geranylgeranylglycerol-phosphate geranylgeranyltransferase [Haloprofundus sp. MHR1]|uniref:geranylgeranylglycerol-phosphate geranylgeranyltransferase n=1 Tax=Haloprofundus sp. MHR1 TaxID=2572921 RepID=UPI0010BE2464|nr:geranylgeranylglycerol-phosphate geranylgeranyltransferase [Haloprofundus sp. MHR1]QCJ48174.1 geranylgeranylglycerol-phosphate geranylgeranyltransferase [Haloprofundus sp. MHR1]
MSLGERLRGLLDLTRPGNTVAAALLTVTGVFVAAPEAILGGQREALAAVAATACATAAGNAVNDYFDREIDRINRPDRAIPRGAVSPRGALVFSLALFLAAVVATAALPFVAIAIAVTNLLALVAYTKLFKGLPGVGNAVVAYLTGSTFLFGAASVGWVSDALVLFLLAAVATFTREVVKDVEDVDGDRKQGLRTLPIVVGERRALWIGVAAIALAILASPVPYVSGTLGIVYLVLVVPADALMLGAALQSFRDPSAGQRRLKLGMFLAAGAFIAGRATGSLL